MNPTGPQRPMSPDDAVVRATAVLRRLRAQSTVTGNLIDRLSEFLGKRGRRVWQATVEDLTEFRQPGDLRRPDGTQLRKSAVNGLLRELRRVFEELCEAGLVPPSVAVAAGVDPLRVSRDRVHLEAVLAKLHRSDDRATIRRLALYAARLDIGPLSLSPEQIEQFLSDPVFGDSRAGRYRRRAIARVFACCWPEWPDVAAAAGVAAAADFGGGR